MILNEEEKKRYTECLERLIKEVQEDNVVGLLMEVELKEDMMSVHVGNIKDLSVLLLIAQNRLHAGLDNARIRSSMREMIDTVESMVSTKQ